MEQNLQGLEGLPPWLQALVSFAFFCITAVIGIFGYTRRQLGKKTDEQKTQDTVVISAAFADTRIIRELHTAIQDLTSCGERQKDSTDRMADAINRQTDAVRSLTDLIRDRLK